MGVDIYVSCDCYKKGLCSKPLYENFVFFNDEDNYYTPGEIKDENINNELDSDNTEAYSLFEEWKENCCKHKDMEYFSDHLGTNMMVARTAYFIGLLEDKFIPVYNALIVKNGFIKVNACKEIIDCLEEINSIEDINNIAIECNIENEKDYKDNLYKIFYPRFFETLNALKKGCNASIEKGNSLFFI